LSHTPRSFVKETFTGLLAWLNSSFICVPRTMHFSAASKRAAKISQSCSQWQKLHLCLLTTRK
jgi:hypothetical protein